MEIVALFFGACREVVGSDELKLLLPEGTTVEMAFSQLQSDYPKLATFSKRLLFAVNESYAQGDQVLKEGDHLAVLPPVSGGSDASLAKAIYSLTFDPIDSRQLAQAILQPCDGAIVTFDGVTRDNNKGRKVLYLEYEAYQSMAVKVMAQIAAEANTQWPINRIALVHRLGRVDIGQTSVAIVVTSAHRKVAFQACHFLIDRLKEIVPIWKREYFEDGAVWVDPNLQEQPSL